MSCVYNTLYRTIGAYCYCFGENFCSKGWIGNKSHFTVAAICSTGFIIAIHVVNPFSPVKAPNLAELCNPITRQGDWARELSKPSTDSASLEIKIEKKSFSVGGFLKVTSQTRHILEILATFGRPWAPTHWPTLLAQSLVET